MDFSVLNTKRRGLADVGESGDTLRAILSYAKEYRPPLIILENIKNAPWEQIRAVFENDQKWLLARHMDVDFWQDEHPYMAHKVFVDTKQYYIPQTRNRGYMILVDLKRIRRMDKTKEQAREMTEAWAQKFRDLARPASASVEAFLLPADDPRLARGKDELSRASKRSRQEVDWTLCKGRHYSTRAQLGLGTRRPLTRWVNGGTATAPDYWWRKHIEVQVERIWDTIEMAYLRLVVRDNYDALWKL